MNGIDGQHHLSQVEFGHLFRQPVLKLTEQSQQVTTHIVVHNQVLQRQRETTHDWCVDAAQYIIIHSGLNKKWTNVHFGIKIVGYSGIHLVKTKTREPQEGQKYNTLPSLSSITPLHCIITKCRGSEYRNSSELISQK